MRARPLLLLAASLLIVGCAHTSPRLRAARALVVTGATVVVVGGLVAAGCPSDGCSAGPDDVDLRAGIPVLAVGAALVATGLWIKPRDAARLYRYPQNAPPGGPAAPGP